MSWNRRVVDVHTHIYPPSYLSLLRSRNTPPYIHDFPDRRTPSRLIILPSDDDPSVPPEARGRPIDASYSSIEEKLKFMDTHGIFISVISLANPWLDFLPPQEAVKWAGTINDELDRICHYSIGIRLYAFATLPLSAPIYQIVAEIHRIKDLQHIKSIIFSTTALGSGLDDPALNPVWAALEASQTLIFLHPHYGLPNDVYGPRNANYGHVLPLALGFPLETTIAFTRMWLSGVFDRYPDLKILIAHAGGAVPYLAGRIESCVQNERSFAPSQDDRRSGPKISLEGVLKSNVYLDAIIHSEASLKAAVDLVGSEKVMFGTDHPFFSPLDEGVRRWDSVSSNECAVGGMGTYTADRIKGGNAAKLLGIKRCELEPDSDPESVDKDLKSCWKSLPTRRPFWSLYFAIVDLSSASKGMIARWSLYHCMVGTNRSLGTTQFILRKTYIISLFARDRSFF
ncbi:MAG: hypothetical protein Q9174_002966 [Haloplaca sp. 1 TL-2023]